MIKEPITAKKHLGQNFLRNKNILENIVDADDLSWEDILEVGPWPWDLTECLLSKHPKSLKVIEIDTDMIEPLRERFWKKIDIYHHDVLKINISKEASNYDTIIPFPDWYTVYGNIPYYITSPILMHFLYGVDHLPKSLIMTMQKEVGDRILARDGKHSVLSLACQLMAEITKICDINPNNFVPIPKVWSTCLRFTLNTLQSKETNKKILTLVKQWFAQKRKKLSSNLLNAGYKNDSIVRAFLTVGVSENVRAEDLSLEDWKTLVKEIL